MEKKTKREQWALENQLERERWELLSKEERAAERDATLRKLDTLGLKMIAANNLVPKELVEELQAYMERRANPKGKKNLNLSKASRDALAQMAMESDLSESNVVETVILEEQRKRGKRMVNIRELTDDEMKKAQPVQMRYEGPMPVETLEAWLTSGMALFDLKHSGARTKAVASFDAGVISVDCWFLDESK